jgi:hypothetical protein
MWGLTVFDLHYCLIILYSLYLEYDSARFSSPLLYPFDLHFGGVAVWMCMV